jgi:sentrin-specific protease 1
MEQELPPPTEPIVPAVEPEVPLSRPVLTLAIEQAVAGAVNAQGDIVFVETKDNKIIGKDMRRLRDKCWLNDEIINLSLKMVQEQSEKVWRIKVYCATTFFMMKLLRQGYTQAKRVIRGIDVFAYDLLLIPLHSPAHWSLLAVDNTSRTMTYYDSHLEYWAETDAPDQRCFGALTEFLEREHEGQKGSALGYKYRTYTDRSVPQQDNTNDCGVFMCQFVEHLSRRAPFNFSVADISYFRKKMAWEILSGKILE